MKYSILPWNENVEHVMDISGLTCLSSYETNFWCQKNFPLNLVCFMQKNGSCYKYAIFPSRYYITKTHYRQNYHANNVIYVLNVWNINILFGKMYLVCWENSSGSTWYQYCQAYLYGIQIWTQAFELYINITIMVTLSIIYWHAVFSSKGCDMRKIWHIC